MEPRCIYTRYVILSYILTSSNLYYLVDCKECEKKLPTSTHLRKHVTDRHGSNVKCKDCDKSFNKSGYKQHRTVAHVNKKEKVFKCNQCDYTSYASKYIRVHKLRLDTIEDLNINFHIQIKHNYGY